MIDLKSVPTEALIAELSGRDGVERSSAGLYQPYSLIKKYDGQRGETSAACILIVRDNRSEEWRRFEPITEDLTELTKLCTSKNLNKEDIMLILNSVTIS